MKRLGTPKIILLNVKLRIPAILKSILGLGLIVLIYVCTYGIHTNNCDKKDAYVASIFGSDYAADRIIQPNVVMHIQRNRNSDTFPDSINNLSARHPGGKAKKFTKNIRSTVKKLAAEDASQSNIDTCHYIDISLIWHPVTSNYSNNSSLQNDIVHLSHRMSFKTDRQLLWNPNVYNNDILWDDEYETGTLFAVLHEHFVPTVIADNTFDGTAQTEINYTRLENSPSEFKEYGQDCKNWNDNFIMREGK